MNVKRSPAGSSACVKTLWMATVAFAHLDSLVIDLSLHVKLVSLQSNSPEVVISLCVCILREELRDWSERMFKPALRKWRIMRRWAQLLQLPVSARSHRYLTHPNSMNISDLESHLLIFENETALSVPRTHFYQRFNWNADLILMSFAWMWPLWVCKD